LAKAKGGNSYILRKGRAKTNEYWGPRQQLEPYLYFYIADTIPPKNFDSFLFLKCYKTIISSAALELKFQYLKKFLQFLHGSGRINLQTMRGGGDQSLFYS